MSVFGGLGSWLDERKIFAIIVPTGTIAMLHELVLEGHDLPVQIVTLLSTGIGGLVAAVTLIAQSIFKSGQTERSQAEAMVSMATAISQTPPTNGTTTPKEG